MAVEFISAIDIHQIPEGGLVAVEVRGKPIAVTKVRGVFHAFDEECTRVLCSLAESDPVGTTVICMCHGAEFDVRAGHVLAPLAVLPLKVYRTKVDGTRLRNTPCWS
jgi:nitrite reductase/ring-hydroxylating ferredoxin subunit